jgi:hypothetical protein
MPANQRPSGVREYAPGRFIFQYKEFQRHLEPGDVILSVGPDLTVMSGAMFDALYQKVV